jgi:ribosomal protein S18 acetylase RimI-like enzyme
MTLSHLPPPDDITCEDITDEIMISYKEKGFTLIFSEEVMRYDLSLTLPEMTLAPSVSYLTWDAQSLPMFFTVYQAAFRERPGFSEWNESAEEWVRWTSSDPLFRPDLSFLAVVQGQAAGFVTNAEDEAALGQNGYLIQIGTHPQWRGQKVGTALLLRSLQAWQKEGKEAVILHVNNNNPQAMRLYQQIGFVSVGRRGRFRRQ